MGKGKTRKILQVFEYTTDKLHVGKKKEKEKKNHWLFKVVKRVDYFVVALQFVTCDKKRNLEKGDATQ